jgi:hypothetical protein
MPFNLDETKHRPNHATDAQWKQYLEDLEKYRQYHVWETISDSGEPGVTYEPKYNFQEWLRLQ